MCNDCVMIAVYNRSMKHLIIACLLVVLAGCGGSSNPQEAEKIKSYLDSGFTDVPWYSSIQGVTVEGDTVTVQTSLNSLDESAQGVCSGTSGYVFNNEQTAGLDHVKVVGANGDVLIDRVGISDSCQTY